MNTVWNMGHQREGVSETGPREWENKKKSRKNNNKSNNKKKVRVTNIPENTTHQDALDYFAQFGSVKTVHLTQRNTISVIFREWEGLHAALACTSHVLNGEKVSVVPCSIPAGGRHECGSENLDRRRNLDKPPSVCKWNSEKERGLRLFIRNVSPHWRMQAVVKYFSQFGDVMNVYLKRNSTYGSVMFQNMAGMEAATASTSHVLDGVRFQVTAYREVRTARVSIERIHTFDEKVIQAAMEKFGTIINIQTFVSTRQETVNPYLGYCAVTFSTHTEALRALDAREVVMQGDTLQILPYGWFMGHEAKRSLMQKQMQQREKVIEGDTRKKRELWDTNKECDGMEGDTTRDNKRRKGSMCDNNLIPRPSSSSPVPSSPTSLAALPPSTLPASAFKLCLPGTVGHREVMNSKSPVSWQPNNSQRHLSAEKNTDAPDYFVKARQKVANAFNSQVGVRSYTRVRRRKPHDCCIS